MTVIREVVCRPGGTTPHANANVKVTPAAPFFLDDGTEIRDVSAAMTDSTGLVSFDLPPTPDGYYYWWNYSNGQPRAFTVPASGGPYWLKDCQTNPTPAPGADVLSKAVADTLYAPTGSGAGVTVTDNGDGTATVTY